MVFFTTDTGRDPFHGEDVKLIIHEDFFHGIHVFTASS